MASTSDLSLPSHSSELGDYGPMNLGQASFALYTLVDLPSNELNRILSTLDSKWMEIFGEDSTHLIRLPQAHTFTGKTLKEVLQAQIRMDKEVKLRSDGVGDMYWWPHAFIVVVHKEWEKKGLLFAYVDGGEETGEGLFPVDWYFFKPKDAYMMLSSLAFGDEYLKRSKELYEIGEDGLTGLEREGVDKH